MDEKLGLGFDSLLLTETDGKNLDFALTCFFISKTDDKKLYLGF